MRITSHGRWPAYGGDPADMIEIDQLLSAYAHTIDSNRYEESADLFTDDSVFELVWQDDKGNLQPMNGGKGIRLTTRADRIRFQSAAVGNPPALPRKKNAEGHQLINRIIDVQGDKGFVRAYRVGGAMQYETDVVRTPQGWKFCRMLIIFDKDRSFPA